jgi:hypothetical protein
MASEMVGILGDGITGEDKILAAREFRTGKGTI